MSGFFQLSGHHYEFITSAKDTSSHQLGELAIYREVGTQQYLVMPMQELQRRMQSGQSADWQWRMDLYKRRFIGRADVFAERYIDKQTHRKAYSTAGPFEDGHRSKTQHYPLSDEVLRRHLSPDDVYAIGIYPVTEDNRTPFLAIDIDGHHENQPWQALTVSVGQVCDKYHIPHLVELSQSGKGCHVWVFFEDRISAAKARRFGDAILQATQSIDPRLPFTAFDRLFPAQDQIGGRQLGNLIAPPLEGTAVVEGRSLFVGLNFQPLPDQWQVLNQVGTLSEKQVEEITADIKARVGFQVFESKSDDSEDLFNDTLHLDQHLRVIRANGLYVEKSGLSQQQILQLKWLASFHNPKFYEAQRNRMPVYRIPRIITLFQDLANYLVLPRGLEDHLRGVASHLEFVDKTVIGTKIRVNFTGELRPNQLAAYTALRDASTGILSARTGFGKTVIAAVLIGERKVSTLILVKNKTLADQWRRRLNTFLSIESRPVVEELTPTGRKRHKPAVGSYYGAKKNVSGLVDIATIQAVGTLNSTERQAFLDRYGMVISDEVHHDSARTFDAVIKQVKSRFLYGLSATPYRRDGQEPIIIMRFGPIRYQTEAIDPVFAKTVDRIVVPRFTNLGMTSLEMLNNGRTENNQAIMNDTQRDTMIIRDCKEALKQGRHIILLTSLVSHVDQLYAQLPAENTFRIYGGFSAKRRAEELQRLACRTGGYVILATYSTAGEGLDVPTLDTMVLAMPISFHGNVEQVVGRLHRDLEHKDELRVYDYVDMFVPMLMRMYRKRRRAYQHLDYQIREDQYSKQKGLRVFDGGYQAALTDAVKPVSQALIVAPKLTLYLRRLIQQMVDQGKAVQVVTQAAPEPGLENIVSWTQYDHNLPSCIILDERQLWFSADEGFGHNGGMTFRLDHPELVKSFKHMLMASSTGFSLPEE